MASVSHSFLNCGFQPYIGHVTECCHHCRLVLNMQQAQFTLHLVTLCKVKECSLENLDRVQIDAHLKLQCLLFLFFLYVQIFSHIFMCDILTFMLQHTCGGQKTVFTIQFSFATNVGSRGPTQVVKRGSFTGWATFTAPCINLSSLKKHNGLIIEIKTFAIFVIHSLACEYWLVHIWIVFLRIFDFINCYLICCLRFYRMSLTEFWLEYQDRICNNFEMFLITHLSFLYYEFVKSDIFNIDDYK